MKAAKGAWIGLFVDYFDIYLPIVALAPAITYFQPKNLSSTLDTTFTYVIFVVAFIGRPIGTFIFGHIGDKVGRRRTTLIAAAGISVTSLITGILPGYSSIGVGALVLLVLVRLVGGIFMGGEYTGANPLVMETCPRPLRGLIGGLIGGSYPLAYISISLFTTILLKLLPDTAPGGGYQVWGWRIPFFIGAVISLLFFLYYKRNVNESQVWEETSRHRESSPLRELFSGHNFKTFVQVFILMNGLWFGIQILTSSTSALLISYLKQDPQTVTRGLLVANIAVFVAYVVFGVLGQRFGRRRMFVLTGAWTVVVTTTAFVFMVYTVKHGDSFTLSMVLYAVCVILTVAPNAMIIPYLCERFPTNVRSSGYGIGYSLGVIIPSFYSAYSLALGKLMPYEYTSVVLLAIGGVLMAVGAAMGPETNESAMAKAEIRSS